MNKYVLALAIGSGALLGGALNAAPIHSNSVALHGQVTENAIQIRHCRDLSGNCDDYTGREPEDAPRQRVHGRFYSHQRYGSDGYEGHSRFWSHLRYGSDRYRQEEPRESHSRYWSHNRYGSGGDNHSRYMSHRRYGSEGYEGR